MDDAFREIYERYYHDVYRFALFLSGHPSSADDLTAETFVRAWTARDRIRQANHESAARAMCSSRSAAVLGRDTRMKISRDVIYDLLPGYFAGEASPDTRALVQEYFETDPELRRMAERFRAILDGTRKLEPLDAEAARERATFDRVRSQAKRRHEARAMAVGFGFAAAFSALMVFLTGWGPLGFAHPGFILACVFGVSAVVAYIASHVIERDTRSHGTQTV